MLGTQEVAEKELITRRKAWKGSVVKADDSEIYSQAKDLVGVKKKTPPACHITTTFAELILR